MNVIIEYSHISYYIIYLPNKDWMTSVGDVVLSEVAMEPVAEEEISVIQGDEDVGDQGWNETGEG